MPAEQQRLLVLYDADCGICTHTARILRRLDRGDRLRLVAAQDADDVPGVPSLAARLDALQVREPSGLWSSGGAAAVRIAEWLPGLRPIAGLARVPGAQRAIDALYAVVAGNRHRISRLLRIDACPVDRG